MSIFNLNNLQHENSTFVTEKINGYHVSYLTVKYLMETLSIKEFNQFIRSDEEVVKCGKEIWPKVKKYFCQKS